MTTTATAPKIVGKALYLELVPDTSKPEDELKQLMGWNKGTKQVLIFPEYKDDLGKTYPAVLMSRIVSSMTPRSQWDRSRLHSNPKPIDLTISDEEAKSYHADYKDIDTYKTDEWDTLPEVSKIASRKLALELYLRNEMIGTYYETVGDERVAKSGQGWVVRDSKPIAVELTDLDMSELHNDYKTPQAVIRRINKVRESISTFPNKLV